MRTITELAFWISVGVLTYTYFGYAVFWAVLARVKGKAVVRKDSTPSVSIIIAAYNEEEDLARKLENTLALSYPKSNLEIIVTSDGSTDRTDEIAKSFASRGVKLHRQSQRLGKTAAQNAAVSVAHGEIVLFSDATTHYPPDLLANLLLPFADPSVGCVTGRVVYSKQHDTAIGRGTNSYWNYEFFLKSQESSVCSLIGVCGCMYAVRKSAYIPLYNEACSDFVIATTMVRQGLRAVFESGAVCFEEPNVRATKELAVRVRIITQTYADLWRNREMFNPFRYPLFSIQLLSHKVLRYAAPLFLIIMLATTAFLSQFGVFYLAAFLIQVVFYLSGALAWVMETAGVTVRALAVPQYFLVTNVASILAAIKLLQGERYVRWEPVRESSLKPNLIEHSAIRNEEAR